MNISWVIAEGYQFDPVVNLDTIKDIGPMWGSWTTWRGCGTDNVICNDQDKATELITENFQACCNLYLPESIYSKLNRPDNVKHYGGNFEYKLQHLEDIVALHLASTSSDIILLLGFDLTAIDTENKHYYGLVMSFIKNKPDIQVVLVDHSSKFDKNFQDLANLTCDTLGNVLQLLAQ